MPVAPGGSGAVTVIGPSTSGRRRTRGSEQRGAVGVARATPRGRARCPPARSPAGVRSTVMVSSRDPSGGGSRPARPSSSSIIAASNGSAPAIPARGGPGRRRPAGPRPGRGWRSARARRRRRRPRDAGDVQGARRRGIPRPTVERTAYRMRRSEPVAALLGAVRRILDRQTESAHEHGRPDRQGDDENAGRDRPCAAGELPQRQHGQDAAAGARDPLADEGERSDDHGSSERGRDEERHGRGEGQRVGGTVPSLRTTIGEPERDELRDGEPGSDGGEDQRAERGDQRRAPGFRAARDGGAQLDDGHDRGEHDGEHHDDRGDAGDQQQGRRSRRRPKRNRDPEQQQRDGDAPRPTSPADDGRDGRLPRRGAGERTQGRAASPQQRELDPPAGGDGPGDQADHHAAGDDEQDERQAR